MPCKIELRDIVNVRNGAVFSMESYRRACNAMDINDPALRHVFLGVGEECGERYAEATRIWGEHHIFSDPTEARYLFRAIDLVRHFGIAGMRIAEIGGGIGSLARLLIERGASEYVIYDAEEPSRMQAKCLDGTGVKTVSDWPESPETFDLVISDYAISEFDEETRAKYAELLFRNSGSAAVVWNEAAGLTVSEGADWLHSATGKPVVSASEMPSFDDLKATLLPEELTCRLYALA